MKKLISFFLVAITFTTLVLSQSNQFVELKNGTRIEGTVVYQSKMFKSPRLIVNDTTSYPLREVKAYQTEDGYFLRIEKGFGDDFAKRIEEGNIDLYTRTVNSFGGGSWVPGPNGTQMYMGPNFNSSQVEYFSKDGSELQKANARNLKRALADNVMSMSYLKKRDGLTAVQVIGVIGGIAIGAASVASQADSEDFNPSGVIIGGLIASGSSWIPYFAKKDLTQKAIRAYNNPDRYNE